MNKTNIESENTSLESQLVQSKEQLKVLQNILDNFFITQPSGKRHLRPNVKEKDIQMLSDAIITIRNNYKDIIKEINLMEERKSNLSDNWQKTRDMFVVFSKESGIQLPKFFKDYYLIDG